MRNKDLTMKEKLLAKMQALDVSPKRSLGQNFLINEYVVEQIFNFIERRAPAHIVEIGPGLGSLTEYLIERWPQRQLIELDKKFSQYWRERGESVIESDALDVRWAQFDCPMNTLILGNLPYQISSRLVIELSLSHRHIQHLVFMFQREVADRLVAEVSDKDYGFLSVVAQSFWSMNKVADASREDFYPAPNVTSRVVAFKRRAMEPHFDIQFIEFVKEAFQFRRKYMLKSLKKYEAVIQRWMKEVHVAETVRAEELSPEMFQKMYSYVRENQIGN